ncbi:MAG: hypothetical protein WD696_07690 [Bryobacteraceae bacterium]
MLRLLKNGVKRTILWDFPRGSWQYDAMVAAILAFIFLTPREFFRDQPRIPRPSNVVSLPADTGTGSSSVFWVDAELLAGVPENERLDTLSTILRSRTGKRQNVTRVEPIRDSENEIKGFMAYTRP